MTLTLSDAFIVAIITVSISFVTTLVSKHYEQKRSSEEMFFQEKVLAYKDFLSVAHKEFAATNPEIDLLAVQSASNLAMLLSTKTTSDLIAKYCLDSMSDHGKLYGTNPMGANLVKTSELCFR